MPMHITLLLFTSGCLTAILISAVIFPAPSFDTQRLAPPTEDGPCLNTQLDIKSVEVNKEKAFEVEVNIIRDEIVRRLDFERRLINIQITFIGLLVVAYINNKGGFNLDIRHINVVLAAILFINSIFVLEIRQNTHHIIAASLYVTVVLNHKYRLDGSDFAILGWEIFVRSMRSAKIGVFSKFSFIRYPVVLASIYLYIVPLLWYVYNLVNTKEFDYLPFISITISSIFTIHTYRQYLNDRILAARMSAKDVMHLLRKN